MKILAINYSQSGQLTEIIDNFINTLDKYIDIDRVVYKLKNDFPFPWTSDIFFDTMPESVLEETVELEDIAFKHDNYDLVIFGYQPWYLSPSIPTNSLLKNEKFKKILNDTDVITIIGSRNMWLNAQESIRKQLKKIKANLLANIVLSDKINNQISAITILYWMLTGKKESFLGFFPKPGISADDIENVKVQAKILNKRLENRSYKNLQEEFLKAIPFNIPNDILFIELRAKKIFMAWAKLIKSKSKTRKLWVSVYKYYLLIALFIIAPIVLFFVNVLIFPFTKKSIQKKKDYFLMIND